MAVALVAVAAFTFYFSAIPLKLALVVDITGRPEFGFGLFPFENRFALRRARQRALGERKHLPWKMAGLDLEKKHMLHAAWQAGRYLLQRIHLEKLHAHGRVAAGDAARTALICGCANLLEGMLAPFADDNAVHLNLQPDFSADESSIRLCGMISVRLGHIICAALIGAWNYILRRIKHGKASD